MSWLLRHSLGREAGAGSGPGGEGGPKGWGVTGVGVHGADINSALALHAGEEPQDSNDFRWLLWRQARLCQRCGHWAAGGIDFAGLWGGAGRVGRRRVRTLCLAFGGSGYELEGYPTNARRSLNGGAWRPWFNARLQTRTPSRPESTNVHEGGDLLVGGCAYCTSPRPPWSTPDARAVAPHPRAVCAELGRVHSVVMGECCRSDRPGLKSGDTEPGSPWATPATPGNPQQHGHTTRTTVGAAGECHATALSAPPLLIQGDAS